LKNIEKISPLRYASVEMTKNYKSDFLNILNERGFIHQCSDFDALDAKLCEGVQSGYLGFDATAKSYHVGNLVQIMMLYWLQHCGHKPITLMGGGTTKVGDPSGKDEMRKMLTDADIDANIESLKTVFAKFLTYGEGKTDAVMVNNDDWLADINYISFLRDYGRHFSINRMLGFESVKSRLDREQNLSFLEFNYSILQAYDFVELNKRYGTILQMGGSDQWGNIVSGVDLGRRVNDAHLFALTTPLITTSDGKKMGKTADGAVWLSADMLSPYDYYQFWRNVDDADTGRFLKLFTVLPLNEIAKLEALQGQEINEAKKVLAFEATKLCHGEQAAVTSEKTAQDVFEKGGVGDDLPTIMADLSAPMSVLDLFVDSGLAASKGEVRRLIKGGGAKINDEKIADDTATVSSNNLTADGHIKLSAGKKKHALVVNK
jgi:tyrosyl-tRNA synthetase